VSDDFDYEISWLESPFDWWVANDEPILVAIPLSEKSAINLMAGLMDTYVAIRERDFNEAENCLSVLASTLIAKAIGGVDELLDVITNSLVGDDVDAEFQKLLENNDK
jgi:hypothetical protein